MKYVFPLLSGLLGVLLNGVALAANEESDNRTIRDPVMDNSLKSDGIPSPADWLASLPTLHYHSLVYGFQGELIPTTEPMLLGQHQVLATGLELPHYDRNIRMDLQSLVEEQTVFYPAVILLDAQFDALEIYNNPVLISDTSSRNEGVYLQLEVDPETRYLVVFTDAEWLGRTLTQQPQTKRLIIGDSYVTDQTVLQQGSYLTTDTPTLKLAIPARTESAPNYLHRGWEIGLGMDFGGDKVAENKQGEPYNAGAGAILYGGYAIPASRRIETRARLGILYQGGEGNSQGLVMQLDAGYHYPRWAAGAGLHIDIAHSIKDRDGTRTALDNTLSPRLFIEYKVTREMRFELAYKSATYHSDRQTFNGDSLGVFMTYHY